jgi:hypothetical protein
MAAVHSPNQRSHANTPRKPAAHADAFRVLHTMHNCWNSCCRATMIGRYVLHVTVMIINMVPCHTGNTLLPWLLWH